MNIIVKDLVAFFYDKLPGKNGKLKGPLFGGAASLISDSLAKIVG